MAGNIPSAPVRFSAGLIAEMGTPFYPDGTVNHTVLGQLSADVADVASALLVGTSVGEVLTLNETDRCAVTETVVGAANEVATIVDITAFSTGESARLQSNAADCGAAAVALGLPYYNQLSADALRHQLSTMLAGSTIPLLFVMRPRVPFPIKIPDLLSGFPTLSGIIDLRGDLLAAIDLVTLRESTGQALELVFPAAIGAALLPIAECGMVSSLTPLAPKLLHLIAMAGANRDMASLRKLWPILNDLECAIGRDPVRLKLALSRIERSIGLARPPLAFVGADEAAVIEHALRLLHD